MKTKRCSMCHLEKPVTEFYVRPHGHFSRCKPCHRGWARYYKITYRAAHPRPAAFRHTPISKLAFDLWSNAVKRSAGRGLPCDLSRQWVLTEVEKFCEANKHDLAARKPFRPSLDRIDATGGYTMDNVRVVWLIENLARNSFTDADVLEFCKRKLGLP